MDLLQEIYPMITVTEMKNKNISFLMRQIILCLYLKKQCGEIE